MKLKSFSFLLAVILVVIGLVFFMKPLPQVKAAGNCSGSTCTFTTATTIGAADATYDLKNIVINNATVTIAGQHHFSSLNITGASGFLTHAAVATTDFAADGSLNQTGIDKRVDLVIDNDVLLQNSGQINVDGKGYPGGTVTHPSGYGLGGGQYMITSKQGQDGAMGGTYGGRGGNGFCSQSTSPASPPQACSGSLIVPNTTSAYATKSSFDFGSGGGVASQHDHGFAATGGAGGGRVSLMVTGKVTIQDTAKISAEGVKGQDECWSCSNEIAVGGSGSGGTISIKATQVDTNGAGPSIISSKGGKVCDFRSGMVGGNLICAAYYPGSQIFGADGLIYSNVDPTSFANISVNGGNSISTVNANRVYAGAGGGGLISLEIGATAVSARKITVKTQWQEGANQRHLDLLFFTRNLAADLGTSYKIADSGTAEVRSAFAQGNGTTNERFYFPTGKNLTMAGWPDAVIIARNTYRTNDEAWNVNVAGINNFYVNGDGITYTTGNDCPQDTATGGHCGAYYIALKGSINNKIIGGFQPNTGNNTKTVYFPTGFFTSTPTVVISRNWFDQSEQMSNVLNVTKDSFQYTGDASDWQTNASCNYVNTHQCGVYWMAVNGSINNYLASGANAPVISQIQAGFPRIYEYDSQVNSLPFTPTAVVGSASWAIMDPYDIFKIYKVGSNLFKYYFNATSDVTGSKMYWLAAKGSFKMTQDQSGTITTIAQ